ncbi:MAG: DUF971 domain-containing protein [Verrucomicrobiae bacterium]|nr:DUF971 domain-containing protein [Verrucomicrobiae bacterium]
MQLKSYQQINDELAILWEGGGESFVPLTVLRRSCPCASCSGERDLLGQVYKGPDTSETPAKYQLLKVNPVGGYCLQPHWGDGHSDGLYTYELLRKLGG